MSYLWFCMPARQRSGQLAHPLLADILNNQVNNEMTFVGSWSVYCLALLSLVAGGEFDLDYGIDNASLAVVNFTSSWFSLQFSQQLANQPVTIVLQLFQLPILAIMRALSGQIEPLKSPNNLVSCHLVDSDFTLTCTHPALTPASNIAWYFNNIPLCLQPNDRDCYNQLPGLSADNGSLLFSAVSLDHAGWYTCATANLVLGRRETDFLVIIQGRQLAETVAQVVISYHPVCVYMQSLQASGLTSHSPMWCLKTPDWSCRALQ